MQNKISILQIGSDNWSNQLSNRFDWHYTTISNLPDFLIKQTDPYRLEQDYVLLTDAHIDSTLLTEQIRDWPAYRVIYLTQDVSTALKDILTERRAFYFEDTKPDAIATRIICDLYLGQQGFNTTFSESQFIPRYQPTIHFQRQGRFSAQFSGDLGEQWQQLGTLLTFPTDFTPHQDNVTWLEYEATDTATVALKFLFFDANDTLIDTQMISGADLRTLSTVGGLADYHHYQILVLGMGNGTLDLNVLHQYRSRHGLGHLLPGSDWQLTSENEEILSYFNPGDRQKPLVVYFSDMDRHAIHFDMVSQLNELGMPYLIFTDSRLQGGAFHIGSAEYEKTILAIIKSKMLDLGLTNKDIILSGCGMGSYPAIYYASDINPAALIIAKPIVNLGTLSEDKEFPHQFNQDWTLDLRRYLAGQMSKGDTAAINNKLWHHIIDAPWSTIPIALFSMDQDDYDGKSLPELLHFLTEQHTPLKHVVQHGGHTEKIPEMLQFMNSMLVLMRDQLRH